MTDGSGTVPPDTFVVTVEVEVCRVSIALHVCLSVRYHRHLTVLGSYGSDGRTDGPNFRLEVVHFRLVGSFYCWRDTELKE